MASLSPVPDTRGPFDAPSGPDGVDLPPGYELVQLRELGDAHAEAVRLAPERGAGLLVLVRRFDLVEFAVVLEPAEPLATARRALFAGMNALGDALAAACPPERLVLFRYPDAVTLDGAVLGGGRLAWPDGAAEDAVPDWLVFSANLRAALPEGVEGGFNPFATALGAEGFEALDVRAYVDAFSRHLMRRFDQWAEHGFAPVGRDFLDRLEGAEPGRPRRANEPRRGLDGNGDLLVHAAGAGPAERTALLPRLAEPSWRDPATGEPRL